MADKRAKMNVFLTTHLLADARPVDITKCDNDLRIATIKMKNLMQLYDNINTQRIAAQERLERVCLYYLFFGIPGLYRLDIPANWLF